MKHNSTLHILKTYSLFIIILAFAPFLPITSFSKQSIRVDVSVGELFDKITILKIKKNNLTDNTKLKNVETELSALERYIDALNLPDNVMDELVILVKKLYNTNQSMWDLEDRIRDKEREKNFDGEFIDIARSVYKTNDKRCAIKADINALLGSFIVEEKSYRNY